ncbi:Crinkler (CRN) family protein [Thraustotheca clavata]|uniref:Crinkler (CRN) family protein n=1 Tax=Thraustotheca clavata TaxID=74557 RepID=A0A1V9YT93_9STRA|nr:Crinkler (CRN) family protein [Thraustotheca clavata]
MNSHAKVESDHAAEISDLFDEIVNKTNGTVSHIELSTVLSLTAGAAKNDLLLLVDEMKQKKLELGKKQFIRLLLKRAYNSWNSHLNQHENVALSHVIVTLKRHRHMKIFSEFFMSKGVAGAQFVGPDQVKSMTGSNKELQSATDTINESSNINENTVHKTKEQLHDQWLWNQRKQLVRVYRSFKCQAQNVFAIVFNAKSRRLELHLVSPNSRHVQIYSSRYFIILLSRNGGQFAVACTSYLGHRNYLERIKGCHHCVSPDALLTNYIFCNGKEPNIGAGLAEPVLQQAYQVDPSVPFSALKMISLETFIATNIDHLHSNHGSITFSSMGQLYEWSCKEIVDREVEKCNPMVKTSCIHPTIAEVNVISSSHYIVPRMHQRAAHEYCSYLSQRAYILEGSTTPIQVKIALESDVTSVCCLWNESKIKMGPRHVQSQLKHMKSISSGGEITIALSEDGHVYSWGKGAYGKLGVGSRYSAHARIATKLSGFSKPITRVVCGTHHVLAIDEIGITYSWGGNSHGQLGTGNLNDVCHPEPLVLLKDKIIIDLMAGDDHSLVLTDHGQVFSFGINWCGQLGIASPTKMHVTVPTLVPFSSEDSDTIYLIQSIAMTCAAVSITGKVYVWGLCAMPLLGVVCRYEPQLLDFSVFDKPKLIKEDFTSMITSVAISAGNVVLALAPSTSFSSLLDRSRGRDNNCPLERSTLDTRRCCLLNTTEFFGRFELGEEVIHVLVELPEAAAGVVSTSQYIKELIKESVGKLADEREEKQSMRLREDCLNFDKPVDTSIVGYQWLPNVAESEGDFQLVDIAGDKSLLSTVDPRLPFRMNGTADVLLVNRRARNPLNKLAGIRVVIELKKKVESSHFPQALGQLASCSLKAPLHCYPVSLLTDHWHFSWFNENHVVAQVTLKYRRTR